jgi:hypothetical protein
MSMRVRVLFRVLLALSWLGPCYVLHAQFHEPTKEELQMTSDPKAPGAGAVYLYREETVDDRLHFHETYARVKILAEKGKELATVHVPYERGNFKVTDIRGRTIHSDGTVIPLTAKPSDLMEVKSKNFQINDMVFTLPSVEVGSILEYRLELRYDDETLSSPHWEIQQPYFVHKAHYSFVPSTSMYITNSRGEAANHLLYAAIGPKDMLQKVVRDAMGKYSLDLEDIPPIADDDWMPPLNSVKWRLQFYYSPYRGGSEFWEHEGKRWAKDSNRFAEPTKTLRDAAAQIVASGDSDEQKAEKLYAAVMKLENTDFTREKSEAERKKEKIKQIKDAEGVWKEQMGSSDQIALLYVALARAAGLQAYPMQVVNRNRAIFDPTFLTTGQLDDYIAVVKVGDKDIELDPGQKMCTFGLLQWKHAMSGGLEDSPQGPVGAVAKPLTYLQTQVQRIADLTLAADGSVSGTLRFAMTGEEALHWRQLSLRNDGEEVKKRFNEWIHGMVPDGVQAEVDHFLGMDNEDAQLLAMVKVTGNLGTTTGKRVFLPGQFFESHGKHPFVADSKREIPVDVQYPRTDRDDVTYHLPEGMTVESSPQVSDVSWPQNAMFKVQSATTQGDLKVTRVLAYNYTLIDPKDYGSLHDFYQKVATADQQPIVLTRAGVVKTAGK